MTASVWTPTEASPEGEAVLAILRESGTLALAERLMDEDAAGIVRPSISFEEMHAMLDRYA